MFGFIKNAFLKGLMILIPVVIIVFALRELLEILIAFATPIADMFPQLGIREDDALEIIAAILIALAALVLGTLAMLPPARTVGRWVENQTLNRLPMYRMLKSLVAAFLDIEDQKAFKPALLDEGNGEQLPVYVIEQASEGRSVIMQPWTPTPFAGAIRVVSTDRLTLLSCSLDEFSLALTHFGLGMGEAMNKSGTSGKS